MKVFVTGATGFLGKAIARRLAGEGHGVTALVLPGDDTPMPAGTETVRGDITDASTLEGRTAGHDAVVHLAGAVGYGQSWKRCIALNREGTRNIALEAVRSGVRRFLHMSSVSVYGRVSGVPIDEDSPRLRIGDPYGDTKIDAEEVLADVARDGRLDLTLLRPTMIYGPGDSLFLPKLVENVRSGSARIIGSGDNRADLVHVEDTAAFVSLVLASDRARGRTYNLTHPANPTWKETLAEVARVLGAPVPAGHVPYAAAYLAAALLEGLSTLTARPPRLTRFAVRNVGRPYHYVTDRMQRELGFFPSIDTLEGLRACLEELPR